MPFIFLVPAISFSSRAGADEVRLRDGSIIKGTITGVTAEVLSIAPTHNADASVKAFKFKIEDVLFLKTDNPLYVDTGAGEPIRARVRGTPAKIRAVFEDSRPAELLGALKTAWANPADNPKTKPLSPPKDEGGAWSLELFTNLSGKTGNVETLGTGTGITVFRKTQESSLKLYSKFNYAKTDDDVSANDFHGGFDYSHGGAKSFLVYGRSDNGYDKIKGLDVFSTTACGGGYKFFDDEKQMLETRLGAAYRYENFSDGRLQHGPGFDVGVNFRHAWDWGRIVEEFTFTPVFEDVSDYFITNKIFLELPIVGADEWKLRLGIDNNYESRPTAKRRKLDTVYFARIVYTIK